jgi:hypothetical protein
LVKLVSLVVLVPLVQFVVLVNKLMGKEVTAIAECEKGEKRKVKTSNPKP